MFSGDGSAAGRFRRQALLGLSLCGVTGILAGAQVAGGAKNTAQAAAEEKDTGLEDARALIGRPLFLRGFYAGSDLSFDAAGHVNGHPKVVDWTLAAVNLEKVSRRGPAEIELEGTRVAIRFNPDQHTFDRHPLKEQRVKLLVTAPAGDHALQAALTAIFSVGIDPALQRSMPVAWLHYFIPATEWPQDALSGQTVIAANAKVTAGMVYPVLQKKLEPEFTSEARQDRVKGTVQLRLVVDADGVPHRIAIRQPLGYGLDERTVETAARYRFQPGTLDGKPAAFEIIVNQQFDAAAP